jgi:pullulanase
MLKSFLRNKGLPAILLLHISMMIKAQSPDFSTYPVYQGNDLGLSYSPAGSAFRVYAPTARTVQLNLYRDALAGEAYRNIDMQRSEGGTWTAEIPENLKGIYYTYRASINDKWGHAVPDPYARMVGVNGRRALVEDLRLSDPQNWDNDKSPSFKNPTDAVIYELHVRDASISEHSGIKMKGKFLGLTESGTKNAGGFSTGLDHLKELGVTHIHLLPSYDFYTVDETQPDKPQYNWGYDPLNYNVPEGSYSTNARDGLARIREFKTLIQAFHDNGLRVVMDVVYNHTMLTEDSWFNQIVPGYYYRQNRDGTFSNATACNNETASERPMMRKYILESVKYWVKEYHVDGFRFDLMGVHDIETMNLIAKELRAIKPDILLYGEGWTAGASPLPDDIRALKKNAYKLDNIAVFSDDIRDGIKGSVFDIKDRGFASGKKGMEESVKFGIVAATKHPQVKFDSVNYSKAPYATSPFQVVTYCECHDNNVLYDKLKLSCPEASEQELKEMHKLALSIVLTSQGITFLHAGTEFLRSKKGVENSFESGDGINAIDWDLKTRNRDVFQYVTGLISMRREHPAFRMTSAGDIAANLDFLQSSGNLISYTINGKPSGDKWARIFVAFNGSRQSKNLVLPAGKWKAYIVNGQPAGNKTSIPKKINAYSSTILYIE